MYRSGHERDSVAWKAPANLRRFLPPVVRFGQLVPAKKLHLRIRLGNQNVLVDMAYRALVFLNFFEH